MDRLQTVTQHMDRSQKAAAKKGFEAASERGAAAVNPFAKAAEAKKWAAWETGRELAQQGARW